MFSILFKADGTKSIYPPRGKHYTLEELQRAVSGYIEIVHVGRRLLVVNEEGRILGLTHNSGASAIATGLVLGGEDIRGDALLCDSDLVE